MKKKGFKLSKLTNGLLTIVMSMGICLPIHALASDGNASAQIDDYEPPEIVSIEMNKAGDYGIPVPDYIEENVSTKVVKIIQSYTGVVNKMVWRKY